MLSGSRPIFALSMALLPFSNSLRALSGIFRRTAGTVIVEAKAGGCVLFFLNDVDPFKMK